MPVAILAFRRSCGAGKVFTRAFERFKADSEHI
jgi:hypothetical protein